MIYERSQAQILRKRLNEYPSFIIILSGPRQVGKSTMVRQVLRDRPNQFTSVDNPIEQHDFNEEITTQSISGYQPTAEWLVNQWTKARNLAKGMSDDMPFVLVIDEIQKIKNWSEIVKGLWDADRSTNLKMHVVLLGSSPLLMQQGLSESLAGRYELIKMTHWSYSEMQDAFNFSLDEYIFFGGYPGCSHLIHEADNRWHTYIRSSLIKPNIEKDILQMTRIDKPALLKAMFELGCMYSGQIISYRKLQGQLEDAGNATTLAHYLELLSQAGLLTGIPKYAGQIHRQRASTPKLIALNSGLMSALFNYTFSEAKADRSHWGRVVESVIGAHLYNSASDSCQIYYWLDSNHEVDFIIANNKKIVAIEVKSNTNYSQPKGLKEFIKQFKNSTSLIVGDGGISIAEFLLRPASHWID